MMREIVIDTETTNFDPLDGHRMVEIEAVELINSFPTGNTFHRYLCPEAADRIEHLELARRAVGDKRLAE